MAVDKHTMRLGLYRKVEIARKQLPNMDEEAFRALLRSEFGVESRQGHDHPPAVPAGATFCRKPRGDLYRARQEP